MPHSVLTRRSFLAAAAAGSRGAVAAPRKPNIVLILADDLGSADLGFRGATDIPTPNIDALARTGVQFTNAYISHPFCSPTRAGIMTGRYQQRFGHENNPRYDPADATAGLPPSEVALPKVLSGAGYATGIVGKWHLGATAEMHPMKRGFRESYCFLGGGHDYFKTEMEGSPREYLIPIHRDGKPEPLNDYLTDALSKEAAAFIRRHANEPFFLYLAYNAPHTPQQVTDKYLARFPNISEPVRKNYAAMISAVDDGVGLVLNALKESRLESDTLVFFLSDNGGPISVNGSSNAPFRGAKGQLYEGGIRTPFIMRWPGRLPAGRERHDPVISLDIFATSAAAAGAHPPSGKKLDGVDLLPCAEGKSLAPPHARLFWRTGGGASHAVREGRYKYLRVRGEADALYDLQEDIGESRDVSREKPDVFARLKRACDAWDKELMAPRFQSPQPAGKQKKK
jgi:arylsulfatase A-like enzyme